MSMIKQLCVEFMGTFLLVVAATCHLGHEIQQGLQPVGVACTVVLIVWMGVKVSGAHYNPNLTLAFSIAHGGSKGEGVESSLTYVSVQLLASCSASLVTWGLDGYTGGLPIHDPVGQQWARLIGGEVLGSFAFCTLVLYTAFNSDDNPSFVGPLAVGMAVLAIILILRDVSGAVINPALATGLWVWESVAGEKPAPISALLAYWFAELLGAALAALCVNAWESLVEQNKQELETLTGTGHSIEHKEYGSVDEDLELNKGNRQARQWMSQSSQSRSHTHQPRYSL